MLMRFCLAAVAALTAAPGTANDEQCDRKCLEGIGAQYYAAYLARDRSKAPITPDVRFSENNVPMPFPDGTWDTVTREVGEPLYLSDPVQGSVGIFMSIYQNDTPGYVAARLLVREGRITEIEHIVSTRRNLSAPPTPFGNIEAYRRDPLLDQPVPRERCGTRAAIKGLADGYFSTLENNTGEIRGTRFSPTARRFENGMEFPEIEKGFLSGRYRFNERVRDRDYFLIDEYRCTVMARGYIDHKGVLDEYELTDGTKVRSIFREPHTWSLFEAFRIFDGEIVAVEATFTAAPYNIRPPWRALNP